MKAPGRNQRLGKWGEDLAARYLEGKGYQILARNFRTPYGEIDLVAALPDCIVFVEVKTRSGDGFGLPEEAITAAKQAHLVRSVQSYWQQSAKEETSWQIDVVAVRGRPGEKDIQVEHFENAIG